MNHFFTYIDGDNVDVFRDADFIAPSGTENPENIPLPDDSEPEIAEAIRFLRGDNIAFEEVFPKTSSRKTLVYVAYIHTKDEVNMDILRKRISAEIQKRLKQGTRYELSVERDRPISYSPSRKDYVVKITA